jgi:membrane-associated phospholipid phosphatase
MMKIPLLKRMSWMLLIIAIQFIYFPTSQATSGGIAPKLPIDVIPVYPVWVVPYYLCYPFWLGCIIWVLLKLEDREFRAFFAAALLTVGIGNLTFLLFPTYVNLPTVPGNDIFAVLLRMVQVAGGTHAALPSAHNYLTMLFCATFFHLYPKYRWLWIAIVLTVAASTLFTGQHYILDVVAGLLLGWVGVLFGQWWATRKTVHESKESA